MPLHRAKAGFRTIRRPVVWLVMLAIVVYGHSAALIQLLGPAHRHDAVAAAAAPGLSGRIDGVLSDLRAWRAALHGRLLQQPQVRVHLHVYVAGTSHGPLPDVVDLASKGGLQAHAASEPHVPEAVAAAQGHAALHAAYQRHHHDPHDPTVVSLDGLNGDTGSDASSQSTAGSATLPLAVAPRWVLPPPSSLTLAWPPARPARWTDAALRLSERPPRA